MGKENVNIMKVNDACSEKRYRGITSGYTDRLSVRQTIKNVSELQYRYK